QHPVLVYTVDALSNRHCNDARLQGLGVACLAAPEGSSIQVAKYAILALLCACGVPTVYLDLKQALLRDPSPSIIAVKAYDMAFSSYLLSDSLNPTIIYSRPSTQTCSVNRDMLQWIWESPFADDRDGLNAMAGHTPRDQFIKNYRDGQVLSFATQRKSASSRLNFTVLNSRREYASGDGWITFDSDDRDIGDLISMSFWSMEDTRHGVTEDTLFEVFYANNCSDESLPSGCLSSEAIDVINSYRRVPKWVEDEETPEQLASSRLVSVSYAEGCCEKSKERNRHSAYDNGIDEVRMYNWSTLDADWRGRNSAILSLPRGAGYWMWKPFVILDTLLDESLPWFSSAVLYLDAGNHYIANPRSLVGRALLHTDVAAPLLKCCLESDWAKRDAIRLLAPAEPPAVVDRPQNAAYFLIFRKTPVAVDFVRRWLRACEDYRVVTDHDNVEGYPNYPTFTRHVHDQTAFSILFKLSGFTSFDLDEAHRVMNLSRSLTKCQMLPINFLKRAFAPPLFFLLQITSSAEDISPKVSLASPVEGPQTLAQIR
ncbi:hypothetical protein FOZ62_028761, partial [Perkinsus olseni]